MEEIDGCPIDLWRKLCYECKRANEVSFERRNILKGQEGVLRMMFGAYDPPVRSYCFVGDPGACTCGYRLHSRLRTNECFNTERADNEELIEQWRHRRAKERHDEEKRREREEEERWEKYHEERRLRDLIEKERSPCHCDDIDRSPW